MMEPMKYELEELLYQMGIYLVQAGAGDFLCILRHALLRKKNTEA